ncbi:uncharacterized protein F5147DRAFT_699609 [Suillus discolor]|uniref:Secreted protein n=1 Tax=Suillus discolor TaxID=1912936 RepID=A0A9P7JT43_9AGAM|nr:uncharacterized protein F5147DRAFT_699609 [Suillus discolor]KAG2106718.1 hypothetical protein F5147DRAFT_699609 [Suillus discolor]
MYTSSNLILSIFITCIEKSCTIPCQWACGVLRYTMPRAFQATSTGTLGLFTIIQDQGTVRPSSAVFYHLRSLSCVFNACGPSGISVGMSGSTHS